MPDSDSNPSETTRNDPANGQSSENDPTLEKAKDSGSGFIDESNVMHTGHTLESGILQRARQWTDVLPWIRLGKVLRLAASPTLLVLIAITHLVWSLGLAGVGISFGPTRLTSWGLGWFPQLDLFVEIATLVNPVSLWIRPNTWFVSLGLWAWTACLWTPVLLVLTRQGALLTAQRDLMSGGEAIRLGLRRTPSALIAMATPLVCVGVLLVPALLLGWLARAVGGADGDGVAVTALSLFTVVAMLPAALLALGSFIAVPAAIAAIINEPSPDPLDALSRGYESVFRRPLQLTGYLLAATFCCGVVGGLGSGISMMTLAMATSILPGTGLPNPNAVVALVQFFPSCLVFALSWGLVGGIFLLLRRDCGGQEVEDLWIPPRAAENSLPDLPLPAAPNDAA